MPYDHRGTYYNQGGLITTKEDLLQLVRQGGDLLQPGNSTFSYKLNRFDYGPFRDVPTDVRESLAETLVVISPPWG